MSDLTESYLCLVFLSLHYFSFMCSDEEFIICADLKICPSIFQVGDSTTVLFFLLSMYPADGLYMPIFRFLVARPEMDLKNVPEFYKLFFSPGSNVSDGITWCMMRGLGNDKHLSYLLNRHKFVSQSS